MQGLSPNAKNDRSKLKRKTNGMQDKEAKEVLKNVENRIEDLRKASMNEINRLENKLESESREKKNWAASIEN